MRNDLDVSQWEVVVTEPDGSTANIWLRDPETRLRWLFKPASDSTAPQERDWAEVVVARIAQKLSVPAALVKLADHAGTRGSLTRHLIDDEGSQVQLQPGSLLLAKHVPDFVADDPDDLRANVRGHSLDNIRACMAVDGIRPPPGGEPGLSAFEHFVGYLVVDALVANTDRHARNWALLGSAMSGSCLAPSYDHGSSLGFQLSDEQRTRAMHKGIARYAGRGLARFRHFTGRADPRAAGCRRPTHVGGGVSWAVGCEAERVECRGGRRDRGRRTPSVSGCAYVRGSAGRDQPKEAP